MSSTRAILSPPSRMIDRALVVAVEFEGGPLDGTVLRTNSPNPAEVSDAIRCYHLTGEGRVGWRFRFRPSSCGPCDPPELYECVATGELHGLLMLCCVHCGSPRS